MPSKRQSSNANSYACATGLGRRDLARLDGAQNLVDAALVLGAQGLELIDQVVDPLAHGGIAHVEALEPAISSELSLIRDQCPIAGRQHGAQGIVVDAAARPRGRPAPLACMLLGRRNDDVRSTRSGTAAFLAEIQRAVWAVNGNLSLANARTLGELYQRSMARTSLALLVLGLTGAVALLLSLVGIYGVYSYAVSRRKHEIGIRIALGAQQSQVRWMFLKHAVVLTGIGAAIGVGVATPLTQLISSQLFGVSPLDPLTYAASALVLVAAGAIASYLPARRASAVDPQAVLTAE